MERNNMLKQPELKLDDAVAWERTVREGQRAFSAFACYRDLGPHRTLAGAFLAWLKEWKPDRYNQVKDLPPKDLSLPHNWHKWKKKWEWEERVAAWDRHLDALAQEKLRQADAERVERRIRQRNEDDEHLHEELVEARERALEALRQPVLGRVKTIKDDLKEGRTIREVDTLKVLDIAVDKRIQLRSECFGDALKMESNVDSAAEIVAAEFRYIPEDGEKETDDQP
jgi:hypothetical protein